MTSYGFFDSGVGGLTVLKAFARRQPDIDFVYFGDTAHCPYGDRPLDEVREYALDAVNLLHDQDCDTIVMACNISSSVALEPAREQFPDLTIHGLIGDPLINTVTDTSRNGRVGILATQGTVDSNRYADALSSTDLTVVQQACSPLVPLVEAGKCSGELVRSTLQPLVEPLLNEDVDTIVLGCTHYPFLIEPLNELTGDSISILDPGEILADAQLDSADRTPQSQGDGRFLVSGERDSMELMLGRTDRFSQHRVHQHVPSEV